jgi:hypothetical protein
MKERPKTLRVVMPSKPITDPTFGYVNAAQTNVQETWKKHQTGVKNAGLFNHHHANRKESEGIGEQLPPQKIRRVL